MRKGQNRTTLVGIRQLLLRIAVMVSLVGLGGALVKTGVVAQTTSSRVLTSAETQRSSEVDEHLNNSYATDRQLPSGRPVEGPIVLAKAQAGEMHSISYEKTNFDKERFTPETRLKNE